MRSSLSSRRRTGAQSGPGSSSRESAGSQKRRNSSPIGVPGPVWVSSALSSFESILVTSDSQGNQIRLRPRLYVSIQFAGRDNGRDEKLDLPNASSWVSPAPASL